MNLSLIHIFFGIFNSDGIAPQNEIHHRPADPGFFRKFIPLEPVDQGAVLNSELPFVVSACQQFREYAVEHGRRDVLYLFTTQPGDCLLYTSNCRFYIARISK